MSRPRKYAEAAQLKREPLDVPDNIGEVFRKLASEQVPIPADMAKVLHDNLWDLYICDDEQGEQQ